MDALTGGVWTVAITLVGWMLFYVFKGPKESAAELEERISNLEQAHHALDKDFARFSERVIEQLKNVNANLDQLNKLILGYISKDAGNRVRR